MVTYFLLLFLIADPWADVSPFVFYGPGAGFGQDYYPENILGPPDPEATASVPACSEEELLTLGENGIVVLEFTDNIIIDGEGADFTVFENVMLYIGGYFRECAFVEASQNGEDWIMFPWNGDTYEGLAGVWPTTGEDPTDPQVSGGDQFDLAVIGFSWIKFVRLTDCGESVIDGGLFDLDAVAAVNWVPVDTGSMLSIDVMGNPFREVLEFLVSEPGEVRLYSIDGRLEETVYTDCLGQMNTAFLPSGVYLLVLNDNSGGSACTKVVKR